MFLIGLKRGGGRLLIFRRDGMFFSPGSLISFIAQGRAAIFGWWRGGGCLNPPPAPPAFPLDPETILVPFAPRMDEGPSMVFWGALAVCGCGFSKVPRTAERVGEKGKVNKKGTPGHSKTATAGPGGGKNPWRVAVLHPLPCATQTPPRPIARLPPSWPRQRRSCRGSCGGRSPLRRRQGDGVTGWWSPPCCGGGAWGGKGGARGRAFLPSGPGPLAPPDRSLVVVPVPSPG